MTFFPLLCFNCHVRDVVSSIFIISCCIANRLICGSSYDMKEKARGKGETRE